MDVTSLGRYYSDIPQNQKERMQAFQSRFLEQTITINGTEWTYRSGGNGEHALVFFHGGYLNGDMYFHQMLAFGDDYRIISPTTPAGVTKLSDIIAATLKILEKESIKPKKLVLLGVSFGGIVSQVFLEYHPERVEKVILSHTLSQNEEYRRKFKSNLRQFKLLPWFILEWLFKKGGTKRTENWATDSKWKELVKAYFTAYSEQLTKELVVNRTKCLVDFWNYRVTPKKGGEWTARILIMASEDDNEMMKKQVEKLKRVYPGAMVHRFEEGKGGHHTLLYFPEEYNNVVKKFLKPF